MAVAVGVSVIRQVTRDMWHVVFDMWDMTRVMWQMSPNLWYIDKFRVSRTQDFFYWILVSSDGWHATCDTRQVKRNIWYVTHDTCHMTNDTQPLIHWEVLGFSYAGFFYWIFKNLVLKRFFFYIFIGSSSLKYHWYLLFMSLFITLYLKSCKGFKVKNNKGL